MTGDRWAWIDQVVQRALGLPERDREAFVREACEADPAARDEVLSLLAHAGSTELFLEPGAPASTAPVWLGRNLGHYRIVEPIGAGGMGEVYRATDTRLGRTVAIKVLPADVSSDPDRLVRFEREAKLISALNHPHIVTLYEVGRSDAGPYLVLEDIKGRSLRELLLAGPLPIRQILVIGAQIADGLARAHAEGIVHRDLKPENVMVTDDGFAKILDFGLAKMVWPALPGGDLDDATTIVRDTRSGVILGTSGYLSPEQAAGKPADYRADQFAFGALLYELASKERPFQRATLPESLTATLRDEPAPLRSKRSDLPAQVEWLVDRCLAKDPNDRYASTKDLARDLADLRDHLPELVRRQPSGVTATAPRARSRRWTRWAIAALAVATVGLGSWFAARQTAPGYVPPSYRPLTFQRGLITGARFSSDGKTVYYSAAFGTEPSRVFMTRLGSAESELITKIPPGFLLGVSGREELAVLLSNKLNWPNARGTLARVPALGSGTPLRLVEGATYADWAPDGERLAVIRDGEVEFPANRSLGPAVMARLSPLGDRVAVLNGGGPEIRDMDGKTLVKDTTATVFGLAWSPDGQEVWFTGSETGDVSERALYALTLSGARRLLARVPGAMTVLDVGRDRQSALIATGGGWFSINAVVAGRDGEQPLDLLGRSEVVGLSSDGQWTLINESRAAKPGTYFRSTDGTQKMWLSNDIPRGLSPNGAWALVRQRDDASRLTLLPTGPGVPVSLPLDAGLVAPWGPPARWSDDGRRLFVLLSHGEAPSARVYMRDGDRPWRAVTPEGPPRSFTVSPEGDSVAIPDASGEVVLFSVDGRAPRRLVGERGFPIQWSADGQELFLSDMQGVPVTIYRRNLVSGRISPFRDIGPFDRSGVFAVQRVFLTPDGRSYVYQYNRGSNELYLAEGVR